ncbi:hypothetical protein P3S67_030788 [Capsicum chacoense]
MGRQRVKADYEELRKAQILENQARFANLGLHKIIGDLRTKSKSVKKKNNNKVNYFSAPLRRSNRLQENSALPAIRDVEDDIKKKPDNVLPFLSLKHGFKANLSPEALVRRCTRLKVGVICHCCSEKKLCGEEDCKRCGDFDFKISCTGKTECSICHSSNGVLCRRCLKMRYGEELEEVRANKGWVCPHCVEEKGIKPYWMCNRALCLKMRILLQLGVASYLK